MGTGAVRIAVLMGGTSDERDVSLSSGAQVANALREAGHQVVAVDTVRGVIPAAEERRLLTEGVRAAPPPHADLELLDEGHTVALTRDPEVGEVDVFFLALHGGSGEDGTIQALLDVAGVAYTGSDRLGCSLAMDKEVTKRLLRDGGIPTPDWLVGEPDADTVEAALGLPVVVKASGGGSSLRLVLAHDRAELDAAIAQSRGWNDVVLYERYVRDASSPWGSSATRRCRSERSSRPTSCSTTPASTSRDSRGRSSRPTFRERWRSTCRSWP